MKLSKKGKATVKYLERPNVLTFGTAAYKIIRKDAPDTSVAAGLSVPTTFMEALVYDTLYTYRNGATIKEVARKLDRLPHTISGRFTGLQEKGLIRDTGLRRMHSCVILVVREDRDVIE